MMEILGQILMLAPPILITAVGACFTEITGVTNLGLEGMMLCGAFAGATVSYYTGNPYMGLAAGVLAGGIISLVHAFISINLRGNQIVSGVAINLLAVALTSYLIKVLFKVAGSTPAAPKQASLMFVLILITAGLFSEEVRSKRLRSISIVLYWLMIEPKFWSCNPTLAGITSFAFFGLFT